MPEKIVEKLSKAASRRSFLGKLSAAAAALVLSMFDTAQAGVEVSCPTGLMSVGCCCLCKDPRTCTYGACACEWSWQCQVVLDKHFCRMYTCRECYNRTPCSDNGCTGVTCSKANFTRISC